MVRLIRWITRKIQDLNWRNSCRQCSRFGHLWDGKVVEYSQMVMAGEYITTDWVVMCRRCGARKSATIGEIREKLQQEGKPRWLNLQK